MAGVKGRTGTRADVKAAGLDMAGAVAEGVDVDERAKCYTCGSPLAVIQYVVYNDSNIQIGHTRGHICGQPRCPRYLLFQMPSNVLKNK